MCVTSKMRKRTALFIMLMAIVAIGCIFGVDVEAKPTSAVISWDETPGAVYYDIYLNNKFVYRAASDERSHEVKGLLSDTDYALSFAARDEENNNLAVEWVDFTTWNWDGIYYWKNSTDETNDGKVEELVLKVETAWDDSIGQYLIVYTDLNGEFQRIIPMYELGNIPPGWTKWKAEGDVAETYRVYADKFNLTGFTPSQWRIKSINYGYDQVSSSIESKIMGFKVETISALEFFIGEDGKRHISFEFDGIDLVKKNMFRNPEEGSDGYFILDEVESY